MSPARWRILTLLFFATIINYLDRIIFSTLFPVIRGELGLSAQDLGNLTAAFQIACTVGFLVAGKFIDRFGTRIGFAVAALWWSLAAAGNATARSLPQFFVWRALLGFGEAGNFPASVKAVAEWFPKKDRAFATGIFNAGTNVASMIGPPVFAWAYSVYGWRMSFAVTAATGLVWVGCWLLFYRQPPVIESEAALLRVGWLEALRHRQTWGFAIGKFLTDPVWWFYLYWLPTYLFDVRHLDLKQIGWYLPVVYLMADVGSVGGGWLSGFLMKRGWEAGPARRLTMGLFALSMPVGAMAVFAPNVALTVALVSLATSSHQGWSANLFTTASDAFPKEAVASVTGIGGCAGGLGGFLFTGLIAGWVVQNIGYTPMFVLMGGLHLVAWAVLQRLVWKR
ncbi:MAG: MFS transporter [Bryobacteraceae bacterium]